MEWKTTLYALIAIAVVAWRNGQIAKAEGKQGKCYRFAELISAKSGYKKLKTNCKMKNRSKSKMKDIKYYMSLPYTKSIQEINDESGHYYYGRILELDGCHSTGNTEDELRENLNEAMEGYIEVKLENNIPIPEPENIK